MPRAKLFGVFPVTGWPPTRHSLVVTCVAARRLVLLFQIQTRAGRFRLHQDEAFSPSFLKEFQKFRFFQARSGEAESGVCGAQ